MSNQYVGSIVILLMSVAKLLGFEIENSVVEGLVVGVIALWVAIKRYQKKDISILGVKKY